MHNHASSPKALVCLLPGLGDALIASPVIRALRSAGYRVHALSMLAPVTEYLGALNEVDEVVEVPLLTQPRAGLAGLIALRRRSYELVVVPFPAARWEYAFAAAVVGGRRTLIHRYRGAASSLMGLVRATQIPLRGGHKIFENVRLADTIAPDSGTSYLIPSAWQCERIPGLLGIHSGSMNYKGNETKRWPLEHFLEFAAAQSGRGRSIRVFAGPNEPEDIGFFKDKLKNHAVEYVMLPLGEAARKISECEVFVSNDSGVAHVAAGLGVKTLTLFGMTNPARVGPIGNTIALRPSACPPCHDEGSATFSCVRKIDYRCIRKDLSVEAVNDAVQLMFDSRYAAPKLESEGAFRLYDRPQTPPATAARP
jgi:heptosyltransferase-3